MHAYISTDNGLQCYGCGLVLDYTSPDDDPTVISDTALDALEDAARALAFGLHRSGLTRAHHYVLEGMPAGDPRGAWRLVCAYDSTTVDGLTSPSDVNPECIGA
jgi:hypothetical protein